MSIFSNLFKKRTEEEQDKVGGVQDFMMLVRVYYQCVFSANLGITQLNLFPDLMMFKRSLHIPTENNKLGVAEKRRCRKMLQELYGMQDIFFKEIDNSVRHKCRNANDVRGYLLRFQSMTEELMMVVGNLMQWKFRIPSLFKKVLYTMTQKTVNDIMTRNDWKDNGIRKSCVSVRKTARNLGYSTEWMTEYVFRIVMLAKKEPKKNLEEKK